MLELTRYKTYSRKGVHSIFAPNTPFTPQAGTWGLQGIIPIPHRTGDFVFFVTFGQQQGTHVFEEEITEAGVLSWQSQPKQVLRDSQIRQFIAHDESANSIYLFLRTRPNTPYTYLGYLKYKTHDIERECPVWFQWQILDWDLPPDLRDQIGLVRQPSGSVRCPPTLIQQERLVQTSLPLSRKHQGTPTAIFRSHKVPDYAAVDARNRALGHAGELLVLEYERQDLRAHGQADLAECVRHVAMIEGDGAGYDIQSYLPTGTVKYIEVKTTRGSHDTAFFMSSNEVAFAAQHQGHYYVYRVYDYDDTTGAAKFFVSTESLEQVFRMTPVQYRIDVL